MTRDQDAMLVQACLRGDQSAFGELVERYEGPLYNAAYRITGSVEDATDATQAAFVNAFEKLDTFDPSHRFFSWIYRITLNQAFNVVSRRRPETTIAEDTPSLDRDPEAAFSETEAAQGLQRALMELDLQYRTVVVLKHIEGYSYREISTLLDIPEKTVKSRLFTARRKLRAILHEKRYVS
jgi:RNA polymerase sigma-70 factor (ECF subfamily)